MTRVAFIGLGVMGLPMARNLVTAGHDVVGFSRRTEPRQRLKDAGGAAAGSIAEAVAGAEVVALMLPDSPDVAEVLTQPDGVFSSAPHGTRITDFSTIAPATAVSLAAQAAEHGLTYIDAPVSGGEQGAIEGALSIMIGGDVAEVEAVRPLLEAVGTTIKRVGPVGSGQVVKAANQLIVAGTIQLVSEALLLLERQDVEVEPALEVLAGGLAGNRILDRKAARMRAREFEPGFRAELHHKDLGIVIATARSAAVPIPLGSAVAQLMAALVAQGRGALDHSALLLLLEELAGPNRKAEHS